MRDRDKIIAIKKNLTNAPDSLELISPSRVLVREDKLYYKHATAKSPEMVTVFLFNGRHGLQTVSLKETLWYS